MHIHSLLPSLFSLPPRIVPISKLNTHNARPPFCSYAFIVNKNKADDALQNSTIPECIGAVPNRMSITQNDSNTAFKAKSALFLKSRYKTTTKMKTELNVNYRDLQRRPEEQLALKAKELDAELRQQHRQRQSLGGSHYDRGKKQK